MFEVNYADAESSLHLKDSHKIHQQAVQLIQNANKNEKLRKKLRNIVIENEILTCRKLVKNVISSLHILF